MTEKDETEDIAKEMDTNADKDVSRRGETRKLEVRRPEKHANETVKNQMKIP